jgi:hypothetical protein
LLLITAKKASVCSHRQKRYIFVRSAGGLSANLNENRPVLGLTDHLQMSTFKRVDAGHASTQYLPSSQVNLHEGLDQRSNLSCLNDGDLNCMSTVDSHIRSYTQVWMVSASRAKNNRNRMSSSLPMIVRVSRPIKIDSSD